MSEKSLKFVLNKVGGTVAFNLSFVLLPAKNNLVIEEQGRKKNIFRVRGTGYIKIIFALLTKIIALYM